jgi:hypothetical protein
MSEYQESSFKIDPELARSLYEEKTRPILTDFPLDLIPTVPLEEANNFSAKPSLLDTTKIPWDELGYDETLKIEDYDVTE